MAEAAEAGRQTDRRWVIQNAVDDVATVLVEFPAGSVIDSPEEGFRVILSTTIPFGHKFALRDLPAGSLVHKYGQVIGQATTDIHAGDHVHVHNLASTRGRGDLAAHPNPSGGGSR